MDRLNYFNPYDSKEPHHEDQLTRAYLVLLNIHLMRFLLFLSIVELNYFLKQNMRNLSH